MSATRKPARNPAPKRAIVIGAGLAGLAAAVELAQAGVNVHLVEASPRAGGRCRSYHDPQIGQTIDNGNHFVFSGNQAVRRYLATIGGDCGTTTGGGHPAAPASAAHPDAPHLAGPAHADFAFHDLAPANPQDPTRWTLRLNDGPLPLWAFSPSRRAPGTTLADHLALARLTLARAGTIADHLATDGPFWHRVVDPMMLAVLNCPPAEGSARLAGRFLRESFARGGAQCRTLVASPTLEAVFVAPALRWLALKGVTPRFGARLRQITFADNRVQSLDFGTGAEPVDDAQVILAVPPWVAETLVPGLTVPQQFCAIVNAHFATSPPANSPFITALLGGTGQWVVAHRDRISVTVSGADALIDTPREDIATRIWADIRATYNLADAPLPPWQIVKEKRATFAATPAQDARRPGQRTRHPNLILAGDWVQTHLPATIEGALRSGDNAARLALGARLRYGPAA